MIISQTPLRISLFGGGTDLRGYYEQHGGAVVSCTIDKYIFVIVKSRYDDQIVLNYSERERVDSIDEIAHPLIREALRRSGIRRSVEITSIADIPSQGSGLGSSSSFSVGLFNALYAFKGEPKNPRELAELACNLEIEELQAPIGKQDQYAAAFGGMKMYLFNRDGTVEVEDAGMAPRKLQQFGYYSNLFFTGNYRKASEVLQDQKENIVANSAHLGRIKQIALEAREPVEGADIRRIGALLDEQWQLKRQLSGKMENDGIREMYEAGMTGGAFGGKLLGAGGGGYFLFIASLENKERLRSALARYRELPISYDPLGSRIILNIKDNAYASVE